MNNYASPRTKIKKKDTAPPKYIGSEMKLGYFYTREC